MLISFELLKLDIKSVIAVAIKWRPTPTFLEGVVPAASRGWLIIPAACRFRTTAVAIQAP